MRYITRELYEGIQVQGEVAAAAAAVRWHSACDAYRAHLQSIRPLLPAGAQAIADVTLHDGVIRAVEGPSDSELTITVDATRNPWGPTGLFRLSFAGVREAEGIGTLIGDDWLYEEVHLHPSARFEYRVLLWRSELRIAADEVTMSKISSDPAER
jgi:hypothetical protein